MASRAIRQQDRRPGPAGGTVIAIMDATPTEEVLPSPKPLDLGDGIVVYNTDAMTALRTLPAGIVNCCVTSPPFWGLRDYESDGQIGLEATPEEYVAKLVGVFQEVKRVLRDDGVFWLNIGDSFARNPKKGGSGPGGKHRAWFGDSYTKARGAAIPTGIRPKETVGIPWMLAFALRASGWMIRQEIIWNKPNALCEPVKAHEQLFLLTKQERYWLDHMQEPGREGLRTRRSVWSVNTRASKGPHCATFPPDLIEPCVRAGCPVGGTVLDPFIGSGTTAEVAWKQGRRCVGIELSADYCEQTRTRIESLRKPKGVEGSASASVKSGKASHARVTVALAASGNDPRPAGRRPGPPRPRGPAGRQPRPG